MVENFKEIGAKAEEFRGCHFMTLKYHTYDHEKLVVAHCKRANFNSSCRHSKHD